MDDLGAELVHQVEPLGSAGQHRLRADVDGEPGDLGAAQLAAELRGGLEQQDVTPGGSETAGRDEAGHAATDHHHVPRHVASLG